MGPQAECRLSCRFPDADGLVQVMWMVRSERAERCGVAGSYVYYKNE